MIDKLSLEEIKDGGNFETLVAEYLRDTNDSQNNIPTLVEVSGIGPDGGVDILVDFTIDDRIKSFNRRWLVQCKFRDKNISPSEINRINIPTLIHSYKASGYLLICKRSPTSSLTNLFSRLNRECKHSYHYECWSGKQFLQKLSFRKDLFEVYFPEYHKFVTSTKIQS